MQNRGLTDALAAHWPEYLIEAAGLGTFMISACLFATVLEHPASPIHQAIADPLLRRVPMGLAMGLTAVAIVFSKWGKRSGAHLNPAFTLTFLRLGKVNPRDAIWYVVAQLVGGAAGVQIAALALGPLLAAPTVNYAVTAPGETGVIVAFLAELAISFVLMSVVLAVSNTPSIAHLTGVFAGALVAIYIIVEAPLSGMSMNPARTLGSALAADVWTALWVYFSAPLIGMLLAAELYAGRNGQRAVACAKLHHTNDQRCIFRCAYRRRAAVGAR